MRSKFYSLPKLKSEVLKIVGRHLTLNSHKVFFFGSRVTGKGDERSDIDIGIEGQELVSDRALARIREEIEELPTLYSIDIIDFTRADDDFKQVAKENMEIINP
jgi:predicted nucleotidyltransferase